MSFNDASDIAPPISVRFWGVRGSVACPGPGTARYGGNTPCVEIRCGEHLFILDAGTGIRPLGNMLVQSGLIHSFDILLSHCHIDHIVGFPFSRHCLQKITSFEFGPETFGRRAISKAPFAKS